MSKTLSYRALSELLFDLHRIRVVFHRDPEDAVPATGISVSQVQHYHDDRYVTEFELYIENVAPGIPYTIVANNGTTNPHGNTKLKTIRFKNKVPRKVVKTKPMTPAVVRRLEKY